jgi:hypothetical protein
MLRYVINPARRLTTNNRRSALLDERQVVADPAAQIGMSGAVVRLVAR